MAHTHKGLTAAAVALAAVAATACSESSTPDAKTRKAQPAQVRTTAPVPTATSYRVPEPPSVAIPAGPVTFADGEAAYQAGNFVEATRVFARYIDEKPGNGWGHYMLGLSAWKGGDLERAEQAFEASLKLDPNHVKSLVNLSRVLLDDNRAAEAAERLAIAEDIAPQTAAVHRLLGRAHAAQGKFDEAEGAYRQAIDLDATDSWSMNNLGLLFLQQGRAADALPFLTQAVELRTDVASFHNNLGMALEHAGRFRDAEAAYGRALSVDPGYEKAARNKTRVEQVKEEPKVEPVQEDSQIEPLTEGSLAVSQSAEESTGFEAAAP